jgi:hypothetical protein
MSQYSDVIDALTRRSGPGKKNGKETRFNCPAHDDESPSLDVSEGRDGKALLQCRSRGCPPEAIFRALSTNGVHHGNGKVSANGKIVAIAQPIDWLAEAQRYAARLTPERRERLAEILKVPIGVVDQIELLGWGMWGNLGGAWTYPERNGAGEIIGIMRRFERAVNVRGDNKLAVKGSKRRLVLPNDWERGSVVLFVTEGLSDCFALLAAGENAIARPMKAGQVREMLAVAIASTNHQHIIILADRDDASEDGNAANDAAFLAARIPDRVIEWAAAPDDAKDVREWLTTRDAEVDWPDRGRDFLEVLDTHDPKMATNNENKQENIKPSKNFLLWKPSPVPFDVFMRGDYRHKWRIRKVLVCDEPAVIFGPSKILKTSTIVDACISLAAGTKFLGAFYVPNPIRVLLISGESGKASLHAIAARVCGDRGIDPETLGDRLMIECFVPPLSDLTALATLKELLEKHRPEVDRRRRTVL